MINAAEQLSKRVRAAMGDHNNDDLPVTQCVINMRKEVVSLQAECERLDRESQNLSDQLGRCDRERLKAVAECEKLRALLLQSAPIIHAHAGASHMLEGFKPKRNKWDALVEQIDAAIAKATTGEVQ